MRWIISVILALGLGLSIARAQTSPGWPSGFVPSQQQWLNAWSSKRDYVPAATAIPIAVNTSPNASTAGATYYALAQLTFTLPSTTFIPPDRGFTVNAIGGNVMVALGASDQICTQTCAPAGVGITISQGQWAIFTTNGKGQWYYSIAAGISSPSFPSSFTVTGVTTTHTLTSGGPLTVAWNSSATSPKTENIPACGSNNLGEIHVVSDEAGTAAFYPITIQPASGTIGSKTNTTISQPNGALAFHCDGVGNWVVDSMSLGSGGGAASAQIVVSSNVSLAALPVTSLAPGTSVIRTTFYPNIVSGPVTYVLSSSNCSAADNGAQVQPTNGTGCWIAQFQAPANQMQWGATGSSASATCSVSGSAMTCSGGTADFAVGEPIAILGAGPVSVLTQPSLSVSAVNGSGTNFYYTIVGLDTSLGASPAAATVSVSGGGAGGILGTPQDFDESYTGNTHGNTTLDNLKVGGVACTFVTCPLANGMIVQNDINFAIPTTITVNSPTSVTLSQAALTSNTGISVVMKSLQQGVFNQLTPSGTAAAFALYESPTGTGSWTCFGVLDASTTLNVGVRNDHGSNHYTTCPIWVPLSPPAVAQPTILRTTIKSITGNVITFNNAASASPSAAKVVHDDTVALQAAIAWNGSLTFACGTYNTFAALAEKQANLLDLLRCATIAGWGAGYDTFTFSNGSANSKLANVTIDDTQKASNFAFVINGPAGHVYVDSCIINNPYNSIELLKSNGAVVTSCAITGQIRGDQSVYLWSPAGSAVVNPFLGNITIAKSDTAGCLLVDSDTDSLITENFNCQSSPHEYVYRNTIPGGTAPFAARFIDAACNFGWDGPCLNILAGKAQLTFQRFYLQGVGGGNGPSGSSGSACVNIAAGVDPVTINDQSEMFGCDQAGVSFAGNYLHMGDGSTEIYNNSASQHGAYPKVNVLSGAGPGVIKLAAGDSFSSGTSNLTRESYGVYINSGACSSNVPIGSPCYDITTAAPGMTAPVGDATGSFGLVMVDGQLNSPTSNATTSGITLSATNILAPDPLHQAARFYRSGPSTDFTDTTRTATQLINTDLPAHNVTVVNGQNFSMQYWNLTNVTATIAGGTGVTPSTCGTVAAGAMHVFTFTVTNAGTPAVACGISQ